MSFLPLIKITRPKQWIKNLMVFFPPFLSGALFHPGMLSKGFLPFTAFCCASSAAYIFNDLRDLNQDILHPRKKLRPLAAGDVAIGHAKGLLIVLLAIALLLGWSVSPLFLLYVVIYLVMMFAYSVYLKHRPIFDVFCISFGFVLRLYGGGEAFGVYVSDWLFLSVFLLALFLSVGKRYSEQRLLGESAGDHRRTLDAYPAGFLESAMYLTGSAVLITYAMYAISTPLMVYSVPLCVFGLLRYLMHIKAGGEGDPAETLLKDPTLFVVGILWVVMVGVSVYQ
jgi:decaprenyl-phosphate phosphoribosyltransferase